jgi:signal transduction protein with GAF and PtsI domain
MNNLTALSSKLIDISNLIENQGDLETKLEQIAAQIGLSIQAQRCSIMLLSEVGCNHGSSACLKLFAHYGDLPASAYNEFISLEQGIAGQVVAKGQPLLIPDIQNSAFARLARYQTQASPSFICTPIILNMQVVGVVNVSLPQNREQFSPADLEILLIFNQIIGQALQISHLQRVVKSRFMELAMTRELLEETPLENSVALNPNPNKFAKIVAKSFFKELTQAGFGANQIIEIASEVLSLLQTTLDKHKQRLTRDEDKE